MLASKLLRVAGLVSFCLAGYWAYTCPETNKPMLGMAGFVFCLWASTQISDRVYNNTPESEIENEVQS